MEPLATFAEELTRIGGPIGGGAAMGATVAFMLAVCAQLWVGRRVPMERWVMWGGGFVGLIALVYEG